MKCLDCGFENEEEGRFCERCGAELTASKSIPLLGKRRKKNKKERNVGLGVFSLLLSAGCIVGMIYVAIIMGKWGISSILMAGIFAVFFGICAGFALKRH
ncbi:hypothetical protein KKC91_03055 [bacterium]|nr:hypothetical protein [bacterium]